MKFLTLLAILVVVFVAVTKAQRVRCPQQARPPSCAGPRNVGTRCPRIAPRRMWYYNAAARRCIEMTHLGCGGNSNRWCTLAGCQRRCARTSG